VLYICTASGTFSGQRRAFHPGGGGGKSLTWLIWVWGAPKGNGFSAVLVINRVSILAILIINRVWFSHSSLELGMIFFLEEATFHHYR